MKNWFKVYLKAYEKWPVTFYSSKEENANELLSLQELREHLSEHNSIYYQNPLKQQLTHEKNAMYKSQILTIVGPIEQVHTDLITIDDIMSLSEAARRWGFKEASTIRNAIRNKKFLANEHRKSDGTWFVTKQGMMRVYGPEVEHDYPTLIVNQIYYDEEKGIFDVRQNL